MPTIHLTSEPDASAADVWMIEDHINKYNVAVTGVDEYHPIRVFMRDETGKLLGGLTGDVWGGWMDIGFLWVDDSLRGQGYGSQLLATAEDEARALGCRHVSLGTYSFQALGFYQKHGYVIVAALEDHPPGHTDYLLRKAL
jgi:GNAT superfamily N-acetyltransferase